MAKVKFSALISEMRNKLNGSVFSRNRGGNYLRNKVTPLNPQTANQQGIRALLTFFSQNWRNLSQSDQSAWNNAVDQWATTDIFGDLKNPTGHQLYIRLNINIAIVSGAAITTPPLPVGVPAVNSLTLTADSAPQTLSLVHDPTPIPADTALFVEATEGLSPGISNANSKFRFLQVVAAGGASPSNLLAAWTARYGALVQGTKVFVRCKLIRLSTGEVSNTLVTNSVVS